jgi:hypothetical protein
MNRIECFGIDGIHEYAVQDVVVFAREKHSVDICVFGDTWRQGALNVKASDEVQLDVK